jgi:hypothetical protein
MRSTKTAPLKLWIFWRPQLQNQPTWVFVALRLASKGGPITALSKIRQAGDHPEKLLFWGHQSPSLVSRPAPFRHRASSPWHLCHPFLLHRAVAARRSVVLQAMVVGDRVSVGGFHAVACGGDRNVTQPIKVADSVTIHGDAGSRLASERRHVRRMCCYTRCGLGMSGRSLLV